MAGIEVVGPLTSALLGIAQWVERLLKGNLERDDAAVLAVLTALSTTKAYIADSEL